MSKFLRHTAMDKSQTKLTAKVDALIEILKMEKILTETAALAIDTMEEKILISMKEAANKKD